MKKKIFKSEDWLKFWSKLKSVICNLTLIVVFNHFFFIITIFILIINRFILIEDK